MRIRPSLVALAVTLLITPTLASAGPVGAEAQSALPLIAGGTVLDVDGRPAAGALELLAWPDTHALEVGDQVELIPVTRGAAGRDGSFSLAATPSSQVLALAAAQGGYVNLELRSLSGDGYSLSHFSRFLETGVRPFDEAGSGAVWRARQDEPAGPIQVRLTDGANRPPGMVVPFVSSRCGPYELKEKQTASTLVGELRTGEDTTMARFTYGSRADSDIGVGMRFGGSGAWSVSGDHHVSNGHASAVYAWAEPMSGEDLAVGTDFDYGRFEQDCYDIHTEQIRSLGWTGGGEASEVISDWGCSASGEFVQTFGRNSGFRREKERAATYGGAAEAFGFSIGARSGHSKNVKMEWEFGREEEHLLCGDDAMPAHSGRVFAGQTQRPPDCRPGRPC